MKSFKIFNKLINEAWYDDIDDSDAYNEPDPKNYHPKPPKLITKKFKNNVALYLVELDDDEIQEKDMKQFVITKNDKDMVYITYKNKFLVKVQRPDKSTASIRTIKELYKNVIDYIEQEFL